MRDIDKIIIHCSATPKGKNFSAETIRKWHVEERGWSDIGYHYIVSIDGSLEYGRPVGLLGAHTRGHNRNSIGICYIGGMDVDMKEWEDTRTDEQKESIIDLIKIIKKFHPGAKVFGHRDFSTKSCPSFDAKKEYEKI